MAHSPHYGQKTKTAALYQINPAPSSKKKKKKPTDDLKGITKRKRLQNRHKLVKRVEWASSPTNNQSSSYKRFPKAPSSIEKQKVRQYRPSASKNWITIRKKAPSKILSLKDEQILSTKVEGKPTKQFRHEEKTTPKTQSWDAISFFLFFFLISKRKFY